MPAWSVPRIHFVLRPCMRAWRISASWIEPLSAWPMCSAPVTFGGGIAIEKFSSGVPVGSGWKSPDCLPALEHARLGLGGLVAGAVLEVGSWGTLRIGAAGVRGADGRRSPRSSTRLLARFDPSAFDVPGGRARLRLAVDDAGEWDFVVSGSARPARAGRPRRCAPTRACAPTAPPGRGSARDLRGGMNAFRGGRLQIRDNLHLGVGFLAATSGSDDPARLELARVRTVARQHRGRAGRRRRTRSRS